MAFGEAGGALLRARPEGRWLVLAALLSCVLAWPEPAAGQRTTAYRSEIVNHSDEGVIELANGARLDPTDPNRVGSPSTSQDALLFYDGDAVMLWIEDEGLFEVDMLEGPQSVEGARAEFVIVSEINEEGRRLVLLSADTLEVSWADNLTVDYWFEPFDALFVEGDWWDRLLNLDEGDEDLAKIDSVY